jgi:hypothetical protein
VSASAKGKSTVWGLFDTRRYGQEGGRCRNFTHLLPVSRFAVPCSILLAEVKSPNDKAHVTQVRCSALPVRTEGVTAPCFWRCPPGRTCAIRQRATCQTRTHFPPPSRAAYLSPHPPQLLWLSRLSRAGVPAGVVKVPEPSDKDKATITLGPLAALS